MEKPRESLGSRISELRSARGMTLTELHGKTGVSVPYISQLEHDAALPARDVVDKLSEALESVEDQRLPLLRMAAEFQRLGYDPSVARLLAELEQLPSEVLEQLQDPEVRQQIVALLDAA